MPTVTSTYAGEVYQEMKAILLTENETVQRGLVNVIDNITYKTVIPRVKVSGMIGPRVAKPTTSYGTSTVDEKVLTPSDAMLYHEFNPRNFEKFWRPYQPQGQLVFRELPTEVQIPFLAAIARYTKNWVGNKLWVGDKAGAAGADNNNLVDGIITKALADSDVIDIASPVALTTANIQAKMQLVYDAVPAAVKQNSNFRMFIDDAAAELYTTAVHDQTSKGNDFTQGAPMSFRGKPVERLVGMKANTILATHSALGPESNLHLAIDWDQQSIDAGMDAILIDRVANNAETYFIRMDFKMDTGISFGEEVVLYTV